MQRGKDLVGVRDGDDDGVLELESLGERGGAEGETGHQRSAARVGQDPDDLIVGRRTCAHEPPAMSMRVSRTHEQNMMSVRVRRRRCAHAICAQ